MWIVSQNGTIISNTSTMTGITVKDTVIEIWHDGKLHNVLGEYSSNEKALAVRDKLIQANKGTYLVRKADFSRGLLDLNEIPYDERIVFQMPKDEDVILSS